MPVLPVSVIAPIWDQCSILRPEHPKVAPSHPLGCHRRRIPARIVLSRHRRAGPRHRLRADRLAGLLGADDPPRLRDWAEAGLMQALHALVLAQYDRMIGLKLDDMTVDGCITKMPGGGDCAGRSPVDRGKQGLKRSVLVDGAGVPLGVIAAGANLHDSRLLASTLAGLHAWGADPAETTVRLDRGYDSGVTRTLLAELGITGEIARKGLPAPVQVGKRWVVERTHAWMNGSGKLRRCTEKVTSVVELYLSFAAAIVVTRCLIQQARSRYRWPGRPPPDGSSNAYCRLL